MPALCAETDGLLIDRGSEGASCDELSLAAPMATAWNTGAGDAA